MVPPRRRLVPTLTIVALLAIFPLGCGSSDDETTSGTPTTRGGTAIAPEPPVSKAGKQGKAKPKQKQGATGQGDPKQPDQANAGGSNPPDEQRHSERSEGQKNGVEGSVCPSQMSRADCKHRIEVETGGAQTPGKKVSPANCTDTMTKQQCEEIVRAQEAAQKEGGSSVSPQTCLEEHGREFCEERFGEQAEQQAGQ